MSSHSKDKARPPRKPDKPSERQHPQQRSCLHVCLGAFVVVFVVMVGMTYILQQPSVDLSHRRATQIPGARRSINDECREDARVTSLERKLCTALESRSVEDLTRWVQTADELDVPSTYIIEVARAVLLSLNKQSHATDATSATKRRPSSPLRTNDITARLRERPGKRSERPPIEELSNQPLPHQPEQSEPSVPPSPPSSIASSIPSTTDINNDDVPPAPSLIAGDELDVTTLKYQPSSFPIAIIACNRLNMIKRSLPSLLAVQGIKREQITVYLDGNDQAVTTYVRNEMVGVKLVQNPNPSHGRDGAVRIAHHYKFSLSHVFDNHPVAPMVIVVEDDMIFAPDFLLYFAQLAPLYDMDPSLYCISSWNDNGFKGLVRDPLALHRTEFFIGLGWLVHRKHYKKQWESQWPHQHWDHWLRDHKQRQGRECIYPEISRNYNIGKEGTFVDAPLFARYFENIVLNNQTQSLGDITRVSKEKYEDGLYTLISNSHAVTDSAELNSFKDKHKSLVIYYEARDSADTIWEHHIAPFFSIWHSQPFIRGVHNGLHQFWWQTNHLILIARYSQYVPNVAVPWWTRQHFVAPPRDTSGLLVFIAEPAQTCDVACSQKKKRCDTASLAAVNSCGALQKYYKCARCEGSSGGDQPAIITHPQNDARANHPRDVCLWNVRHEDLTCAGSHRATSRLCACF